MRWLGMYHPWAICDFIRDYFLWPADLIYINAEQVDATGDITCCHSNCGKLSNLVTWVTCPCCLIMPVPILLHAGWMV